MSRPGILKTLSLLRYTPEAVIVAAFAAMLLVGGLQVVCRLFNASLGWSEELQRYLHIWVVFLAIPLGYKNRSHIGMNVLYDKFPAPLRAAVDLLIHLLWAVLGFAITAATFQIMNVAKTQTSPGLGITMNWIYLCMVIGGAYLVVLAGINLVRGVAALLRPRPKETAC